MNSTNIQLAMEDDRHHFWGWVIYRCTYKSDADWEEFMRRARENAESELEMEDDVEFLDSMQLKVFDDKENFDGASTADVRAHFQRWCETAPYEEQGTGPGLSARYRYCIQVDEASLTSVLHPEANHDPLVIEGYVKKDWKRQEEADIEEGIRRGELRRLEPIDGDRGEDVGWMMINFISAMVGLYQDSMNENFWTVFYRRPPMVVT